MTTTADNRIAVAHKSVIGHLALHYMPGDEHKARHLPRTARLHLVDNGPAPGPTDSARCS